MPAFQVVGLGCHITNILYEKTTPVDFPLGLGSFRDTRPFSTCRSVQ